MRMESLLGCFRVTTSVRKMEYRIPIKSRLERCGADCRKVAFINEETYSGLTLDDERIRQAIIEFRPRLVVIDPIQAYLGSDSDLRLQGEPEN